MLVFPQNRVLSINKERHVAKEITEDYFQQCKAVGDGPRYCPKEPIQLTETSTTCLTGLYGNEMQIVVRSCPILHLNATQPYVAALSPHHFSMFLPSENTARGTCGGEFLGSVTLPAGLRELSVDPLCKLVTPHVVIEPTLEMINQEVRFDRIKLNLTLLANYTDPVAWAVGKGKVAMHPSEVGPSLQDIEKAWKDDRLHVQTHLGLLSWIGIIVGSALALVILICTCKCGWECYTRKRNREQLKANIREHVLAATREVRGEEHEMEALRGVPSAPPSE